MSELASEPLGMGAVPPERSEGVSELESERLRMGLGQLNGVGA